MSRNSLLPDHDIWQPDGHVTDVALAALADGERSLVPEPAASHVDECDSCTERLGEQALLSISLGEALSAAPAVQQVVVEAPAARFPVAALVVALVVAGIGALPAVFAAPHWLSTVPSALLQGVPVTLRAAMALVKIASSGSVAVVVTWLAATCVLCAIGMVIARLAPREVAWKGVHK